MSIPSHDAADEELAARLPLPLSHLYLDAAYAKSALERHQTAFYLWEATIKLAGAAAVVTYSERTESSPEVVDALQSLARPAFGHWWSYVRLLVPILAEQHPEYVGLRNFLFGGPHDYLPRLAGLDVVLRESLKMSVGPRSVVSIEELCNRIVTYRNREIGHGAVGRRTPDHYDRVGRALAAGAAELLRRIDPLAGRELIFVKTVERDAAGGWTADCRQLCGASPRRRPPLRWSDERWNRLVYPQRVYLVGQGAAVEQWTSFHPLAVFDSDANDLLLLNSRPKERRSDYISYRTGAFQTRPDAAGEQRVLLAKALKMEVTSTQVEDWADKSPPETFAAAVAEPGSGRFIGDFELLTKLGKGAMGIVYRARQAALGRQVALKCQLHVGDSEGDERFQREIRALGRVTHPNLVRVFTSGTDGDQWYYAMELIEGATLATVCTRLGKTMTKGDRVTPEDWRESLSVACDETRKSETALAPKGAPALLPIANTETPQEVRTDGRDYVHWVVDLVRQAAEAAHALHDANIVHRDIKPGNIMVGVDGRQACLMDLGLAQFLDENEGKLTRTRRFVGTLRYASPEQVLAAGPVDRRSDIYSLGATLWELLTLQPLYNATDETSAPEVMRRIQSEPVEPPRSFNRRVSRDLEAVALRCLAKSGSRRYATARELADDLQNVLRGESTIARPSRIPTPVRRAMRMGAPALKWLPLAALAAGFLLLWRPASQSPTPSPGVPVASTPVATASSTAAATLVISLPKPEAVVPVAPDRAPQPRRVTAPFGNLTIGKANDIAFAVDESTRSRLTRRELLDQLRDELLMLVVTEAGLSSEDVNRALFDVPIARYRLLRSTARFDCGATRTAIVGDDHVVALLPKCAEMERRDYLTQIADEYRKDNGELPETVLVFEYDLVPDRLWAVLTRRPDVVGAELFTAAYGYHEAEIATLPQFMSFLTLVDDLTYASTQGVLKGIKLGGREHFARKVRGFTAPEVASIWQAQQKLVPRKTLLARLEREHDALSATWQAKLDAFNADKNPKKGSAKTIQEQYDAAAKEMVERQRREFATLGIERLGFSLDPSHDYAGLKKWFEDQAREILENVAKDDAKAITSEDVAAARRGLEGNDVTPLVACLAKLSRSTDSSAQFLGGVLNFSIEKFRFQAGRYDGELQGTEVGMALFYTDLLIKLWFSLDIADSSPQQLFDDFETQTNSQLSPIYRKAVESSPHSRIWYLPEETSFQHTPDKKTLLLGSRATRLTGVSSRTQTSEREVPANPSSERIFSWWNDHYDELAGYEPEFGRLNAFMKWTLLMSWLINQGEPERLVFLSNVPVDRSAWFPDWAKQNAGLRFRAWDQVGFLERGVMGTTSEAFPILHSRQFSNFGEKEANWTVAGGVSGAAARDFEKLSALPDEIDERIRLSMRGLDRNVLSNASELKSVHGTNYSFIIKAADRSVMRITPPPDTQLRDRDFQFPAGTTLDRTVVVDSEGYALSVRMSSGAQSDADNDLAMLRLVPKADGFTIAFRALDTALGVALASKISVSSDVAAMAAAEPGIDACLLLPDHRVLLLPEQSTRWMKIEPVEDPKEKDNVAVPPADMVVAAGIAADAKILALSWLTDDTAADELQKAEAVQIGLPKPDHRRAVLHILNEMPETDGLRKVELGYTGSQADLHGWYDPKTTSIVLALEELPAELFAHPLQLAHRFDVRSLSALRDEFTKTFSPGESKKSP